MIKYPDRFSEKMSNIDIIHIRNYKQYMYIKNNIFHGNNERFQKYKDKLGINYIIGAGETDLYLLEEGKKEGLKCIECMDYVTEYESFITYMQDGSKSF